MRTLQEQYDSSRVLAILVGVTFCYDFRRSERFRAQEALVIVCHCLKVNSPRLKRSEHQIRLATCVISSPNDNIFI